MSKSKLFEKIAVTLSDPQVLDLGKELAQKRMEINALEEEKSGAMKAFNAKIHTLDAQIDDLARQVSERKTEKDIEIIEEHDDARLMVLVKNAETGQVLRHRKMTLEEMRDVKARQQGGLFDGPGKGDDDDGDDDAEQDDTSDGDDGEETTDVHDTEPPPPVEQKLVQIDRKRRSRVAVAE